MRMTDGEEKRAREGLREKRIKRKSYQPYFQTLLPHEFTVKYFRGAPHCVLLATQAHIFSPSLPGDTQQCAVTQAHGCVSLSLPHSTSRSNFTQHSERAALQSTIVGVERKLAVRVAGLLAQRC